VGEHRALEGHLNDAPRTRPRVRDEGASAAASPSSSACMMSACSSLLALGAAAIPSRAAAADALGNAPSGIVTLLLGASLFAIVVLLWIVSRVARSRASLRAALIEQQRRNEDQSERLTAFVDGTSDVLMTYTEDGRLLTLDVKGQRLFAIRESEVRRHSLRDVIAPSYLPLVALAAGDVAAGRSFWGPIEILTRSTEGRETWLHARVRAVLEDTELVHFELAATNIDPQKCAQRASIDGAAMLQRIALHISAQGTSSELLEIVCTGLGYEDAELWNADTRFDVLRFDEMWRSRELPPPPPERASATIGKGSRLAGRSWASGAPVLEPDLSKPNHADDAGPQHFRSGLAFPVRLAGQVVGVVALFSRSELVRMPPVDLLLMVGSQIGQFAQRQRTEEHLRQSEARNRTILECTVECVISTNERGEIIDFNPAAERTFGYARAEVLGRPLIEVIVPPSLRQEQQDPFSQYLQSGGELSASRTESLALRADGREIPIEVALTPVMVDGRSELTAFIRDISQRKEIETLKDNLLSTVSHELRTPLTSVRGFVELLLLRNYPPEQQKNFLCIIDSELRRLTRLINDFLDLQRIEAGRQTYHLEAHDLVPLIKDCVEVSAGSTASHEFELMLEKPVITVSMDLDRIQQVIMNLISNAVKFSPEGGTITIAARLRGDFTEVSVTDTGIGMAPEIVEKLFSKFFRADNSATRQIEGTGLGLALVREIVTAHGGEVRVESKAGEGSTFSFTLERARLVPALEKSEQDPEAENASY